MCTLIALHRCVARAGLLVAANRDEYLDRPSEGPAIRQTPHGPIVAPLDIRAGGTWFGVNSSGVFAALTNRPCPEPDPNARSRGHVPVDALRGSTAEEAAEALSRIPAGEHNPFNAFVADGTRAFALVYEGEGQLHELAPGAHVVGNADPDARSHPKVGRVLEAAERAAALDFEDAASELQRLCALHEGVGERGPLDDTCVHAGPYGTRSSFLLASGCEDESDRRLWFKDGPPCRTEYVDFTALLSELTHRARYGDVEHQARTTG